MIKTNVRINKKAVIFSVMVSLIYLFNYFHQVRYGAGVSDSYYHLSYVRALFSDGVLPKSQQSYPLFFYFIALFVLIFRNYTLAALLFVAIWAFASNYLQIEIIRKLSHKDNGWYVLLAGSALSFVWPITFHALDWISGETTYWWSMLSVYLTSGASAPYHNLTYLCAKPFALLSIYAFLSILDSDEDKIPTRFIVTLAVSLLFSVLAKPCFYQCFAPAGTLFVVGYFIKGKYKELKKCLIIAATFVPATIWVLFSMTMKVQPIALSPFEGITMNNSDGTNVIVILGRAIVYVLFICVCLGINKCKDNNMILGLLIYLFGVIEWTMLIFPLEKGALDMMWGYNMAVYLFFLFAIIAAKKLYDVKHNKLLFITANVLLAAHAILGILMFTQPWINAYKTYIFG